MYKRQVYIDATDRFLDLLAGVSDPEKKRKIIGGEFIKVFDEEASKLEGIEFLAPVSYTHLDVYKRQVLLQHTC